MGNVRYAFRAIARSPGYAVVVVTTLGLALGAITALYSVADATFFRGFPEGAVGLYDKQLQYPLPAKASWPEVRDWRASARSLAAVAADRTENVSYVGRGEPERIAGTYVSEDYFRVFPVVAASGRLFAPEEHRKGAQRVALLSDGFWQRAFGGDPTVVGRLLQIDGDPVLVVGILPAGQLEGLRGAGDLWMPLEPYRAREARDDHYLNVFARLAPGVTIEAARAELDALAPRLDVDHVGHGIGIRPLGEALFGQARPALVLLLGASLFVLLVAGANVTSLMLARMNARTHELGVRAALGARRGQLVRHLLTESLILSLIGGALGMLLALWAKDWLLLLWPAGALRPTSVPLAWRTLAVAAAAATAIGALVGAVPALRGSRTDLAATFRRGVVSHRGRLRSALVVLQYAVSAVLLVGGALLGQSLLHTLRARPGFDPTGVVTMSVSLPERKYPDYPARQAFYNQALARLRALPGVTDASVIANLPFGAAATEGTFDIVGRPKPRAGEEPFAAKIVADGELFRTLRIPLLAGRTFTPADVQPLAVVNQTLANRYFPGESPIGKHIDAWAGPAEIVGVVGDVRRRRLDEAPEPQLYLSMAQVRPWGSFVVRTGGDPSRLIPAMKELIYAIDPAQPIYAVGMMDDMVARSSAQRQVIASMVAVFAAVALLLAALGIYGVLSHQVGQRTREIGVRMALGARAASVLGLVLGQGMRLALLGTAIGATVAFLAARLLGEFLYRVSAFDPVTYLVVTALLLAVGAFACFVPARRASRVDPMTALRYE